MAKIGCLKPFRGSWNGMKDYVLEGGEIAFITEGSKMIYFGDGTNAVKDLTPFADIGGVDISSIGSGSITSAISTLNSNKADIIDLGDYTSYTDDTDFVNAIASNIKSLFGNGGNVNVYANITYTRSGSWIGTMEYSPYQNGYISILVHYYQPGYAVHFGTTNGFPFYEEVITVKKEKVSPVTISLTSSFGFIIVQETIYGKTLGVYAYTADHSTIISFVELKIPSSTLSYSISGTNVTFTTSTGANIAYRVI